MKKKFKVTLIVFLVVVLGCFSQVFAATNQSNKADKISQVRKNARFLDSTTTSSSTQSEEVDQYTKLLMHMDNGTFKDECGHTITNNGVTVDTSNKKFGDGSAKFNNLTSTSINIPYSDCLNFGTGDFTIDFWAYQTAHSFYQCLLDMRNTSYSDNSYYFGEHDTSKLLYLCKGSSTIAATSAIPLNTWYHVAIVRYNGVTTLYLNGQKIGSFTDNSSITGLSMSLGNTITKDGNNYCLNGNIDEFEISNTARWTSDFTPPTSSYDSTLATGISLNKTTDVLTTEQTDTTLTATVTPDNATNKTVIWKSSDEGIVKVDQNTGVITSGSKAGTATITATTTDGTNLSASCTVTVTEPTSITLDKTADVINVGDTDKITASVTPAGQTVTWSSSDKSIATVDDNGNIKGLSAGTVVITATTAAGKTVSCTVNVKDKETGKSKLILYMNDNTIREFYLTQDEIDDFIDWYTLKIKGEATVQPYYVFNISVPEKSATKKSYVWFMKIESFEVE